MSVTLAAAMRDPKLLGEPFKADSFWPWHTVAKVISGEALDDREAAELRLDDRDDTVNLDDALAAHKGLR